MSTASKTWDKKTIFHSELMRASQGGLAVRFTGKPRDSKYPGKPAFVGFQVMGDDGEYTLNIENDKIRAALEDVPVKMWVAVRADGRGEDAWISIEDANGNPVLRGTPESEVAQPQNAPPPLWNEQPKTMTTAPTTPVSTNGDVTVQRAVGLTLQAVKGLESGGVRVDSDAAARIFNTLYIQASR